jgi:hypothetical protein
MSVRHLIIVRSLFLGVVFVGLQPAYAEQARPPAGREWCSRGWKLFLDDDCAASQEGLSRVWHRPTKFAGNPIIRPDQPWEGRNIYLYGTVLREGPKWRMWYQVFFGKNKTSAKTSICYAESSDGCSPET